MFWQNLFYALSRKKYDYDEDEDDENDSSSHSEQSTRADESGEIKMNRVLGLIDLTMLGVGATLGVGVYVLAGSVARNQAGPSVIVSFMIAATASLFSGLCYSEFASKISKSGSAYNYTYISIGEFAAYIIGWNLILEYVIGTASEAKAISNQIDSLFNNAYANTMEKVFPINSSFLSTYPDFIAAFFVMLITTLLCYGVKESTKINNIFTFVNLITVCIIVAIGIFHINLNNWNLKKENIPKTVNGGNGGFMPFGINGIIVGAAKCFFGFVGFDGISTTGEETKNPKRNIPLSIILSLFIVFVCYFSIAVVLTLILPYYQQNADAPFPYIFDYIGLPIMKWAITIGSLLALFTAMFGAFFPLPRILYSMARDGLLYKCFSYISPTTKTPLISTVLSGIITAIMSSIFKLDQLVDMMSIGTLLAYIIVAICILLLRFCDDDLLLNHHHVEDGNIVNDSNLIKVQTLGLEYNNKHGNSNNNDNDNHLILIKKETNYLNKLNNKVNYSENIKTSNTDFRNKEDTEKTKNDKNNNNLESGTCSFNKKEQIPNNLIKFLRLKAFLFLCDLLNINKNNKRITSKSQSISKFCIYSLVMLTIVSCLIINNITSKNMGIPQDLNYALNYRQIMDNKYSENDHNNKTILAIVNNNTRYMKDNSMEIITLSAYITNSIFTNENKLNLSKDTLERTKYITYVLIGALYITIFVILCRQTQNKHNLKFSVPFVPLIPCVSIFMNMYLMINLDISTWVRFVVWLTLGLIIYFTYSIFNSKQKTIKLP